MNVKYIEPVVKNGYGMDKKIYDHYLERKIAPSSTPKEIGPVIEGIDVGVLRYVNEHPTWPLTDITETEIEEETRDLGGYRVRYYHPLSVKEKGPAVFFVHGGGFNRNTLEIYDSPCRRLAELLNGVVFSVSYTLSPEAKFPTALEQCYTAIKRMLSEADRYYIDPEKVAIMGDSAGGNLAAALCVRDKETKYIKMQILYYPALDLTDSHVKSFDWKFYGDNITELAKDKINQLYKGNAGSAKVYLKPGEDPYNPLISPFFQDDYTVFPRTLMFTAEYDFLTMQAEEFCEKLEKAGVKTDYYKCLGTFHGYLERTGFFDQGDITLKITADTINDYFKK